MTIDSNIYEEYSKKIHQLRLKVIDDVAHPDFLKGISETDSHHVIRESELKIEKISHEEIEKYESQYRIKIPNFIKFIMTEIGQSNLVCFWFFRDNKINKPFFYFSHDFFYACLKEGISSDYLNEFNFDEKYDNDTNTFKDPQIQAVFKKLHYNDETYIIKLLPTGHGDCSGEECVILNELHNGLVVYTVGWHEKIHLIDGLKYSQYDYRSFDVQIEDYCMTFLQTRLDTTNNLKELTTKQKFNWNYLNKFFKK